MTRIETKFKELATQGRKAFIPYITAGDPSWHKTVKIIHALEKAGADILELGVPFSDPMADGPAIQEAMGRALKTNINLDRILAGVKEIRKTSHMPILIFSYYNPIHKMGIRKFASRAKDAGVDGVLVTDLTPESAVEYKGTMDRANLNTVFLTAPTTPTTRLKRIADICSGFVYYVSRTGVTGVQDKLEKAIATDVRRIKSVTRVPVAVGFGISKPEHVVQVARDADGIVVGSAIVRKIHETRGNAKAVERFVKRLVAPLH